MSDIHRLLQEIASGPGVDSRHWVSYGTVEAETEGQPSVEFDADYGGPLVYVKLHPSAARVTCRVASWCAGNGEAEYYPFIQGDEVLVVLPEGDERAGPVIVGRMNSQIDVFPTTVAGNDVTKNNFGFRRMRAPFMIETAQAYGVRNAVTGSLFMMAQDGTLLLKDAFTDFLHMGPDFVGLQATTDTDTTGASPFASPDAEVMIVQMDKTSGSEKILLEVTGKTRMVIGKTVSALTTNGTFSVGASGAFASEHAISTEAVVNLLASLMTTLNVAIAALPGTLTGPSLAAVFLPAANINASLALAGAGTISAYSAAIQGALSAKAPNPTGMLPSVGCPGFLVG